MKVDHFLKNASRPLSELLVTISQLQKNPAFSELKTIVCRVDPYSLVSIPKDKKNPKALKPALTESTRVLLHHVAQATHSAELRKAFLHLSRES